MSNSFRTRTNTFIFGFRWVSGDVTAQVNVSIACAKLSLGGKTKEESHSLVIRYG